MEVETDKILQKYYTTEQLLAIVNQLDLTDFNCMATNDLNSATNHDLKYTRRGVYSFNDNEDDWHRSTSIRCHCNVQFDTVFAYDNHYNAQHRYLCTQCQKHLPSAHLLDLHLSEQHDSFFAVQAERKPMYACFLEECPHKSSTPAERRDHCITQHKLPHDFRFGTKKSGGQSSNKLKPEPATATKEFQQSTDGMHSMTTQHLKIISFGHGQAKTFLFNDQCYAKRLTRNHKRKKAKHVLDDDKIMVDLLESLPN